MIQQNAAGAEELSATAEELTAQAEQLRGSIGFFRLESEEELPRRETSAEKVVRKLPTRPGRNEGKGDGNGGGSTRKLPASMAQGTRAGIPMMSLSSSKGEDRE